MLAERDHYCFPRALLFRPVPETTDEMQVSAMHSIEDAESNDGMGELAGR